MHIESVVDDALKGTNLSMTDLDAIAVTNRPGKLTGEQIHTLETGKN